MRIPAPGSSHTVIITVDTDAELLPRLVEHARMGIEVFPRYPGFLGGATHVSEDGTRLVQYLQWSSAEAYRACVDDPAWDELPSTQVFLAAVRDGAARLDARAYHVVSSSGGDPTRVPDLPDPEAAAE